MKHILILTVMLTFFSYGENLSEKECEDFVKRNEHLLFEVNTSTWVEGLQDDI